MFRFIGKRKRKEQQEDQHVHLKWAIEAQRQAKEADQNTDEQMQRADDIAARVAVDSAPPTSSSKPIDKYLRQSGGGTAYGRMAESLQ
jgi:hypothetical protein